MIIALVFKRNGHRVLQSFFNYALMASKRRKHNASTHIKFELRPKFCQSQARIRPKKPGPTYNSDLKSFGNHDQ